MGLSLNDYWEITPLQFKKYVDVYQETRKEKLIEFDALCFNLGKYIALGVNSPNKYPKKPFLTDIDKKPLEMTAEEMENRAKSLTMALGGTIKE